MYGMSKVHASPYDIIKSERPLNQAHQTYSLFTLKGVNKLYVSKATNIVGEFVLVIADLASLVPYCIL